MRDPFDPLADFLPVHRIPRIDPFAELLGPPQRQELSYSPLPDAEYHSALSSLLGGLQYVGETLDKPGRAVRGLLAGRPSELLNLIPFSDTLGITAPQRSVSGRDLLEQVGALDKNTEGFDTGDVAGFGAEMPLDPLTYLTFGASAATKAGRIGNRLALHPDDIIKAGAKRAGVEPAKMGLRQARLPAGVARSVPARRELNDRTTRELERVRAG